MTQTHARGITLFVFLSLAIAASLFAAAPATQSPSDGVSVGAAAVQWQSSSEAVLLRVSGPNGFSFTKEFAAGATPSLRMQDLGAKSDGAYTWELRVIPRVSSETKAKLAAARAADDDDAIAKIRAEAGLDKETTYSGAFTVASGAFVSNANEEAAPVGGGKKVAATGLQPRVEDVVTADDEIIQGSLCVGLDCVNNESFGFDTIRLKENNTRIKFDDTSTSAGFPNNDWQLTANDSASGGANKFSIEDITGSKVPFTLTAGAPTNSLFVASSGKVGFGNSSPVLNLHITATDTPAIRQEQTNGGGFTAQTWDIGANEANWFVRDVTGGSRLPLRIRPGATTSSIDISADGDVGINTASPNANTKLDVFDDQQVKARISLTGQEYFQASNTSTDGIAILLGTNRSSNRQLWIGDTATLTQNGTNKVIRIFPNSADISARTTSGGTTNLTLQSDGGTIGIGTAATANRIQDSSGAFLSTGGAWTNASSRELKQDICDLDSTEAMQALKDLTPVKFAYKVDPAEHHVGFIAEDVPALVSTKDHKSLSSMDIVAVLTKVVQEQQQTIDELKSRLDQLEKQQ